MPFWDGQRHNRVMVKCVYCGEDTKLHINGLPVCVTCADLAPDEREKRKAPKSPAPEPRPTGPKGE